MYCNETFASNCGLLSVRKKFRMPKEIFQCSKKTFVMWVDDYSNVEIPRVSFEYLSVLKATYWFPCTVFGCDPRISMETKSSGSAAEKC